MNRSRSLCLVALLVATASPLTYAGDSWMVKDIARDTGMHPVDVRLTLGTNIVLAEHNYAMHPSTRGHIQRTVVRGYERMLADGTLGPRARPVAMAPEPLMMARPLR